MAATFCRVAFVSAENSDISSAGGGAARLGSTPDVATAEKADTATATISTHLLKRLAITQLPARVAHETEASAPIFPPSVGPAGAGLHRPGAADKLACRAKPLTYEVQLVASRSTGGRSSSDALMTRPTGSPSYA